MTGFVWISLPVYSILCAAVMKKIRSNFMFLETQMATGCWRYLLKTSKFKI